MIATPENFYTIEAENENELFEKLGATFGSYAQQVLAAEKTDPHWLMKVERAQHLLRFTEGEFPQYVAQLQHYAEAVEIDFLDLWTLSLEDDADPDGRSSAEHCTSIVTNRGNLIGQIEDWNLHSSHKICLLQTRVREKLALQLYYINTLGGSSLTVANGRVQLVDSVRHAKAADGIPKNIIARYLSDVENIHDGVTHCGRINAVSGYAYTFVLPNGRIMLLETAPHQSALEIVPSPSIHTNHYLGRDFKFVDLGAPGTSSKERLWRARELVKPHMDVDDLKRAMSDTSQGPDQSLFNKRTVGRMIVDRNAKTAHVSLARNNNGESWFTIDLREML